jgi:hypothetical protein
MRAITSVALPAVRGITTLTGLVGQACAKAADVTPPVSAAVAPAASSRRRMNSSW